MESVAYTKDEIEIEKLEEFNLRSSNFESLMGGSIDKKQSKTAMDVLRTTIEKGSDCC
jgi:hypothetical protein